LLINSLDPVTNHPTQLLYRPGLGRIHQPFLIGELARMFPVGFGQHLHSAGRDLPTHEGLADRGQMFQRLSHLNLALGRTGGDAEPVGQPGRGRQVTVPAERGPSILIRQPAQTLGFHQLGDPLELGESARSLVIREIGGVVWVIGQRLPRTVQRPSRTCVRW
jgi:hypothetical protein